MKTKFKLVKDKSSFQITWKAKSVKELLDDEWVLKWVEVEWYASTKDKDRWSDIVEPEAFKNALSMYMLNPIVLLQHDMDKPIGIVEEAKIDDNGLYIKAKITENEDWVFSKLVNGVLRSFSIGYRVKDYEDRDIYNSDWEYAWSDFVIKELELYEISIVSVPMNPYALMKSMADCFEKEEEVEETQEVETAWVCKEEWETTEANEEETTTINEEETVEEPTEEKVEETPVEEEVKECETTVEQMDEIVEANTEETTEEAVEEKVEEEKVEDEEVKEVEEKDEDVPLDIEAIVPETSETNENVEEEVVEEAKSEDNENTENVENQETVEETEINDWADKETEDQESENVVETTTDEKVDKGLNLKEMSRKSIETFILSETKSIKESVLEEVKWLMTKKDEEIAKLKEDLANTQKALAVCADVIGDMDNTLSNTALKSGFAYEKPHSKKQSSAYWKVADYVKKFNS